MDSLSIIQFIKGGLVVSCQALEGEPLYGEGIMARMAVAAECGGAVGIRANGKNDISDIKQITNLPVIGIVKKKYQNQDVFITPTIYEVSEAVEAGADIVAFDATMRKRPDGSNLAMFIEQVKLRFPKVLLMADISTLEEGEYAANLGVDIVATTLSGYTSYSEYKDGPDFDLIAHLSKKISQPVIAEGRISSPTDAVSCLNHGAWAVVVGSSITRPQEITNKFVKVINDSNKV